MFQEHEGSHYFVDARTKGKLFSRDEQPKFSENSLCQDVFPAPSF